jgi:hypothetical protein
MVVNDGRKAINLERRREEDRGKKNKRRGLQSDER